MEDNNRSVEHLAMDASIYEGRHRTLSTTGHMEGGHRGFWSEFRESGPSWSAMELWCTTGHFWVYDRYFLKARQEIYDKQELAKQELTRKELALEKLNEEIDTASRDSVYTRTWSPELKRLVFDPTPLPDWVVQSWVSISQPAVSQPAVSQPTVSQPAVPQPAAQHMSTAQP